MRGRSFRRRARDWEAFGQTDPLFGILSDPHKHGGRWDVGEFFASGQAHIDHLFGILTSRQIEVGALACLDFGCGVGRLTVPLSRRFERTVGVDVAPAMIERARDFHRERRNCQFVVNRAADLRQFPAGTFDLVHSCLVLQHIEPVISLGYVKEFFRVARPGGLVVFQLPAETRTEDEITATVALPEGGYVARTIVHQPPAALTAGQAVPLSLTLTNASTATWRHDLTAGRHITIGNHWWRGDGTAAGYEDGRSNLPITLAPGESVDVVLTVTAPSEPGRYLLEIDLCQEAVCWFAQNGSPTTRLPITVEPGFRSRPELPPPPFVPAAVPGGNGTDPDTKPRRWPAWVGALASRFRQPRRPTFSMYTVPRQHVEALIRDSGGRLVDAIDDNAAGAGWQSYTYICRRNH